MENKVTALAGHYALHNEGRSEGDSRLRDTYFLAYLPSHSHQAQNEGHGQQMQDSPQAWEKDAKLQTA